MYFDQPRPNGDVSTYKVRVTLSHETDGVGFFYGDALLTVNGAPIIVQTRREPRCFGLWHRKVFMYQGRDFRRLRDMVRYIKFGE